MSLDRWRIAEEDYIWPGNLNTNLTYMPKLHDVPAIKFGLDHAAQISSPQGYEARTRYCQENRFSVTYLWECLDSKMRDDLRYFYEYDASGGLREFWMPLWLEEFACTIGIQGGASLVWAYPNGYSKVFPNWIYGELGYAPQALLVRLKNGNQYVRPIIQCAYTGAIVLEYPFPIDMAYKDIFMVSRCMRWTFSSGLTERWIGSADTHNGSLGMCEMSASFTVVSGIAYNKGRWGYIT